MVGASGKYYGSKTYAYDAIGNITLKDGITFNYGEGAAGPHALTSASDGSVFSYDANGNMVSLVKGGVTTGYQYDLENRLTKVAKAGKDTASFDYDGDGGRVKKTAYSFQTVTRYKCPKGRTPPSPTAYFPQADKRSLRYGFEFLSSRLEANAEAGEEPMQLALVNGCKPYTTTVAVSTPTIYVGSLYEKTNNIATKHIFLGSQRIATINGDAVNYYHPDHLGSSNIITDQFGTAVQHLEYDPYGAIALSEGQNKTDYRYAGKELDEETGLYYYGARYYNPLIGRFITPDTIVQAPYDPQSLNRYSYCRNNPVNYIDPTGHSWKWGNFFKAIGIAIVGAVLTIFSGGALAPLIGTYWAGVATGAMAGATIGGSFAAATGGNIGMGILTGAIGGAVFAGLTPAFSGMMKGIYCGTTQVSLIGKAAITSNFVSGFLGGAASGAAVAGVTGADVGEGALIGGAIAGGFSLMRDTASIMRAKMVQQSRLDSRNSSGISDGIEGDNLKLAGDRYNPFNTKAGPSPLGGHQGQQGKIFGFNYPPKGIVNHILESWAGPHDWLNGWTYDSIGNLRQLNLLETGINTFTNPLNVAIAAPLAIPLALPREAAAAPGIIYGNQKE